jgi:hypothetical protein
VIGSTAPDLPYALSPYVELDTHAWPALLWFCVPITLLGTWLVRPVASTIAAHLPNLGRFALHDYGVLGRVRHRAYATVWSAFVGAATHLGWDTFTHERATRIWTFLPLDHIAFAGQPWWHVLQIASTAIGALVTVVLARHIGRKRLLIAWHGRSPAVTTHPARFWTVTIAVGLIGLATLPLLAQSGLSYVLGVRLLIIAAFAVLAGSVVVGPARPARLVGPEDLVAVGSHAGDDDIDESP